MNVTLRCIVKNCKADKSIVVLLYTAVLFINEAILTIAHCTVVIYVQKELLLKEGCRIHIEFVLITVSWLSVSVA